jgi:hypothetical protein
MDSGVHMNAGRGRRIARRSGPTSEMGRRGPDSIDERGGMRESDERDAHQSIRRLGVVAPLATGI